MTNVIESFLRTEYKYRMNRAQVKEFMERSGDRLVPDQYHRYTVYNVYCDTADDRMVINSLEHPEYKEKMRIRSYVEPSDGTPVFLEIKKKYKGLTGKRRITLREQDAYQYMTDGTRPDIHTQIADELDYSVQRYKPVMKVYASYDRTCWKSVSEDDVRVTFDENILYRTSDISLHPNGSEQRLIDEDTVLLEIKASDRCPMWLTDILSEMGLKRTSFSKYGNIYRNIMTQQIHRNMIPAYDTETYRTYRRTTACSAQY
ncbi:MAG: polyphosphate polymerase domain-containing protein [Solobacterium sp.]|nr:polyphosphate polymerase domain-containing protein [Solobacterium sp.]